MVVNLVNPDLSRCVDDGPPARENPCMYNLTLIIIKEGDISGNYFLDEVNQLPLRCLLPCIPSDVNAFLPENNLGQS